MTEQLLDGLIWYCCLVPIIAIHEFGHAWASDKCGDPTARHLGRVTLNPIAHMDMVGTVILPLAMIMIGLMNEQLAGFIIGWGKPVPVVTSNLRNPARDSLFVAMAGPFMNLVLAAVAVLTYRIFYSMDLEMILQTTYLLASFSLFLMFFNLLPIPPLDGSYILKYLTRMDDRVYMNIAQYGFLILIISIQIPAVQRYLSGATGATLLFLFNLFQIPVR